MLYFVALSNLSASSYQLWSQSKTLFTAFFFVRVLHVALRPRQWLALTLLTAGVGLVQLEEGASAVVSGVGTPLVGIAAVLASSVLSAFANVYFEKVIKQAECEFDDNCDIDGAQRMPTSLWIRNVQLGLFAIPQAALMLLCNPTSRAFVRAHGAFGGFTPAVWLATSLTAAGGLLVAAVVKHTDNLLKTYGTANRSLPCTTTLSG